MHKLLGFAAHDGTLHAILTLQQEGTCQSEPIASNSSSGGPPALMDAGDLPLGPLQGGFFEHER